MIVSSLNQTYFHMLVLFKLPDYITEIDTWINDDDDPYQNNHFSYSIYICKLF